MQFVRKLDTFSSIDASPRSATTALRNFCSDGLSTALTHNDFCVFGIISCALQPPALTSGEANLMQRTPSAVLSAECRSILRGHGSSTGIQARASLTLGRWPAKTPDFASRRALSPRHVERPLLEQHLLSGKGLTPPPRQTGTEVSRQLAEQP